MKKLMTLLGVMAFALGAFAANISGVNFDNVTSLGKLSSNTGDNETMTPGTTGSTTFWYSAAGEDLDASVTAYADDQPVQTTVASGESNVNYLKIESAPYTAPLYRSITANTQDGDFEATSIGDGLYIDTLVQFTVGSDTADLQDNAAKLALWVGTSEDTENAPTNIFVRAGYISESGLVATNYVFDVPTNFSPENWYRVTVKAINNIVPSGTEYVGFVVFVDGVALEPGANAISDDPLTLAPAISSKFSGKIFPSMIPSGATSGQALSAVGFSGTGAVDDLAFTAKAPFDQAKDSVAFRLNWDDGVASLAVTIADGQPQNVDLTAPYAEFEYNVGATVTISVTYKDGYESTYGTSRVYNDGVPAVVTIETYAPGAAYWDGSAWVNVADIATALAEVSENGGMVKLLAAETQTAASGITVDPGQGNAVVLDLAGKTLRGQEDSPVIVVESGTLVITNSTVEVGKILADDRDYGKDDDSGSIIIGENAALKVYGGLIDGIIYGDDLGSDFDDGVLQIFGGTFYDSEWDPAAPGFVYAPYVAEGKYATPAQDEGVWYVTVGETAPTPETFIIRIVKTEGEPVEYDTLPEAIAAYEAGDIIELGSEFQNLTGDDLKVFNKAGTFTIAINQAYGATMMYLAPANGYKFSTPMTFDDNNCYYYVVEDSGIAKVIKPNGNETWYQSYESAYGNAASGDSLIIKLTNDLTVASWADGDKALDTITFLNETESALTVTTYTTPGSGVYYYMKAANWVAPANVTLKLYSQTVTSINAGTLEVPAGVKLTLPNFANNITVNLLKGAGRLSCAGRANNTFSPLLRDGSNWTGTMEMTGFDYLGGDIALKLWGNANSTVCFSDVNLKFVDTYNSQNGVKALEIGPGGLGLKGAYDSECTIVIPAKVTGTGTLTFAQTGSALCTYNFTGDFSEFAGSMTIGSGAQNRVYIGTNCSGGGACISIANGATATVASGKTWNSQNGFVVLGTLNVAGTLKHQGGSAANVIYGAANTGRIVFKNAAAITTFGGAYKGEIVIDSIAAGDTSTAVPLNFGCSEARMTLNGVSGNAWCAGSDYTVQPEVTLAGDVNFQNGSSGKTVTFRKIAAGTGNLSLKTWSGCTGVAYGFTTIDADNYTGTIQLDGSVMTFNVGNILKVGAAAGNKVLNLTVANNATVNLSNATLNGEAANLELKSDGIYVAVPAAPAIDPDQGTTVDVDTTASEDAQRAEAQTKAAAMDVTKTEDASAVDQATWNGYFTKTVEKVDDKWVATAALNPAAVLPVDDTVEEAKLTDMLESVTAAALDDKTPTAVPTKAGLYYWIAGATEVGATTYTPGTAALGDGTKKALTMPTLDDEDGKAFYKVCVGVEAPVAE